MRADFQFTLQIPAFIIAIIAWITSFVALLTPAWQVTYARELQQWIESGLWMSCNTRPAGMYTCVYTFSKHDYNFYTQAEVVDYRTPAFYPWQRKLLAIYLGGQFATFIALISFCCSLQKVGKKISSLVFAGAITVCLLLHAGASGAFLFFSQSVEYRFYLVSVSGIYDKHFGYSAYTEFVAVFLYFISLILCILHLIKERLSIQDSESDYKYDGFRNVQGIGPYRQVDSYYPRPGSSSASQPQSISLDQFENQYAMRELPPIPGYKRV